MGLSDYARAAGHLLAMKRNQWLGPEELRAIAEERLLKVVRHARDTVPFYRKRLGAIRSLDELPSLPLTSKKDICANPESFISGAARGPLHTMYTSGSSGIPLKLFFDRADSAYGFALGFHSLTECGFGPGDLLASLTSASRSPHPLRGLVYRIIEVPSHIAEAEKAERLSTMAPDCVMNYPSSFTAMALSGRELEFRRAFTCSESLSPRVRNLIERSFGCTVRDFYGANESWSLGWECEKGRMHLNSDSVIVEILDDEGNPARRGNVVITSLWRYSMPMIRYNLGDIASLGSRCPCGRGTAVLGPIEGRRSSLMALPDGTLAPWSGIQLKLKKMHGILQFQGIQESGERLIIQVVPLRESRSLRSAILAAARSAVGGKLGVQVEFVNSIPRSKSGKTADFVSKVRAGP